MKGTEMIGDTWNFVRDSVTGTCEVIEEQTMPCGCVFQKYVRRYSNHPLAWSHRIDLNSEPAKGHRKVCLKR
jgi:hypothetical protein